MGVLELIQQKAFLGKEFLTWLWHKAEADGKVRPAGGKPVEIEMLSPMALDAQYGDTRNSTLRGETPATSPEARTALIEGKKLSKVKLKWTREGTDWTVTLDGETLNVTGLTIPSPGRLPFEDQMSLRMEMVMEFEQILSQLFETFLELRLDEKIWGRELKRIHEWVRAK